MLRLSPFTTAFEVVKALPSIVPTDEALNIPTSSTVEVPDTLHVYTSCRVSLVTVVVTRETVAAARERPLVDISATRAVCPTEAAVAEVPTAK